MSDYEIDYDDDEQGDFSYSEGEEDGEELDGDIETLYYLAKGKKEESDESAKESFEKVLEKEGQDKGEWGFKALKQLIKLHFKVGDFEQMMVRYQQLLAYMTVVARDRTEKAMNSILDILSSFKQSQRPTTPPFKQVLELFYRTTLDALHKANNHTLWFKIQLKLARLHFTRNEFAELKEILEHLLKLCSKEDGSEDISKGSQLLEVYAQAIQMHTAQKDNKNLKILYNKSLNIRAAIPHPLNMGIIRECGGKMHLREREYEKCYTDFFEAFKNFAESGSARRTDCLKYCVLACMLMESEINPFDSQEATPYKTDAKIVAMSRLLNAYQKNDLIDFEATVRDNPRDIGDDAFIREHMDDIRGTVRSRLLMDLTRPYRKVLVSFLAREMCMTGEDVEDLIVSDILNGKIRGKLNQVQHVLEIKSRDEEESQRFQALDRWMSQLGTLHDVVTDTMQ